MSRLGFSHSSDPISSMLRIEWWRRWWWAAALVFLAIFSVLVTLFYLVVLPIAVQKAMEHDDFGLQAFNVSALTNTTLDIAIDHNYRFMPFKAKTLEMAYLFKDHLDRKLFHLATTTISAPILHIPQKTIQVSEGRAMAEMLQEQLVSEHSILIVRQDAKIRALGRTFSSVVRKQVDLAGFHGLSSIGMQTGLAADSKLFHATLELTTTALSRTSMNLGPVNMTLQYQGISFADMWCPVDLRTGMNTMNCLGRANLELLSNPSKYSALKRDIKKDRGIPSMLISRASLAGPLIQPAMQAFNSSITLTNSNMKTILSTIGTLSGPLFYWIGL